MEDKERVGVCLDTCHALAAGQDFRTAEIEETVGIDSVVSWHFNDSTHDHGSRKDLQNLQALDALVTDPARLPEGLSPNGT